MGRDGGKLELQGLLQELAERLACGFILDRGRSSGANIGRQTWIDRQGT
jgi:hypothetical protein